MPAKPTLSLESSVRLFVFHPISICGKEAAFGSARDFTAGVFAACLPACLGMPAVCNSHNFPLKSADTSCFFVKPQLLNWHSYLRISKGDFQPFLSLKKTWNIAETLQCPATHVHWATVDYLLLVSLCFLMFSQYFPSVQVTIFVC